MQTFLYNSSDAEYLENQILKFKEKYLIGKFNYHEIIPSPSIGINQIREIEQVITRKPFAGENRLIVLKDMQKATPEAQNALLKILEEPPQHTYIILTTANKNSLLPTVLSRCQLEKEKQLKNGSSGQLKTYQHLVKLTSMSEGQRLIFLQNQIKNKQDALDFLEQLLDDLSASIRSNNHDLPIEKKALWMKKIHSAKYYIERNINFKAVVDILFLGL